MLSLFFVQLCMDQAGNGNPKRLSSWSSYSFLLWNLSVHDTLNIMAICTQRDNLFTIWSLILHTGLQQHVLWSAQPFIMELLLISSNL